MRMNVGKIEWNGLRKRKRKGNIDGRRVIRKKNRVQGIKGWERKIKGGVVWKRLDLDLDLDYWLNGLGVKKSKIENMEEGVR